MPFTEATAEEVGTYEVAVAFDDLVEVGDRFLVKLIARQPDGSWHVPEGIT